MRVSAVGIVAPTPLTPRLRAPQPSPPPAETPETMAYKGHGMIEHASQSQSISHVMAHELAHANSYRTKAFQEGLEITSEDIDIQLVYRDGQWVAVAGQASATFAKRADDDAGMAPQGPSRSAPEVASPRTTSPVAPDNALTEAQDAEQRAADQLQVVEAVLQRISSTAVTPEEQTQLGRLELERAQAESALRQAKAERLTLAITQAIAQESRLISAAGAAGAKATATAAYSAQGRLANAGVFGGAILTFR